MSDLSSLIADLWQPIETAPKDGTAILVLVDGRAVESEFCEDSKSWLAGGDWGLTMIPPTGCHFPLLLRALQQKGGAQ